MVKSESVNVAISVVMDNRSHLCSPGRVRKFMITVLPDIEHAHETRSQTLCRLLLQTFRIFEVNFVTLDNSAAIINMSLHSNELVNEFDNSRRT